MKRRFTILMTALLLMFSYVGLAQVVSGTTYSTPSVDNLPTGWSGEDGGGTSYVKLIADSHYIQTAEFEQNGFTSITIKARKFGGPSATQAQITVSWYDSDNSETVLGTIDPSNTTLSNYTINSPATSESGTGYIMIQCKGASSSKGSGVSEVTITYTEPGGTTPTTYTVTYNSNVTGVSPVVDTYAEGADVTLRSANTFTNDGFTFNEWNTQADGDGDPYDAGDVIENIQANIELYAIWEEIPTDEHWVLAELAELTANDVFVIVGNNGSNYAMSNGVSTTTAPSAISVTVTGNEITSAVAASIQWNISGDANDGYTFYPNGDSENWLYCTNTNNGVRVGTNDNKTFVIDATSGYLKHNGTSRYVGIYNSSDWRCYTSYTQANIANQTFAFYKKVTGEVLPPSITANNVNIAYDATSGEIAYTLNNGVEGGALTASTESDWLTLGEVGETVPFTCLANEATVERTATVVLTYTFGDNETVSKDVTVTQAAAPLIYTTIPAMFEAATSTATDVNVTFGSWVISAVKGSNAYLTDNQGNGLIIYASNHGFQVNDILTGTASCKLQTYRGSAELTNLTTSTEGLTVANNGTVTEQNIAISELGGVNTGALLAFQGLTYNGTALVDGNNNTITPYNTLYSYTFEEGKTYNVKGIYLQYNQTKELLPRSAADIEEVVTTETHTLTIDGYTDDNVKNGYYLIASPVTVNPADVEGLTEGTFDLYYYDDTQDLEWINYETQNGINADFGNLVPGQGYLYAKKAMTENQTYSFNLTGVPYNGDGEIDLIAGWNLVGNPFGQEAEISMDYYAMNQDGSELTPVTASTNVAAMQGVFVYSAEAGTVMFMPAETGTNTGDDKLVLNVTGNRGNVIDRAIVRFGQGGMLPKFQLHENSTKISIAKDNKDYAVVSSETQGEMPVSFMASENGTYTFSVNVENVEMNYLHLIDNMTGADIDLIANPSYSFVAKTSDYTNRFRLVFNANNGINELSNENFAFFNGSELIVNNQGEATLQVVDILGRVINSQNINGNENISFNVKSGAYMIRLINGNDVKTQKIVVE
ncbi:MAG: InlB B-repeat-containing protein [Bacteroidales bacterium]|nr:InlB B-repeat-containing protein [Bacteroidales bacterium]